MTTQFPRGPGGWGGRQPRPEDYASPVDLKLAAEALVNRDSDGVSEPPRRAGPFALIRRLLRRGGSQAAAREVDPPRESAWERDSVWQRELRHRLEAERDRLNDHLDFR